MMPHFTWTPLTSPTIMKFFPSTPTPDISPNTPTISGNFEKVIKKMIVIL